MSKINKLEAEILIEQHVGNIRLPGTFTPLKLDSKSYKQLLKNLKENDVDIYKEISEKVVKYNFNEKEYCTTIPLEAKINDGRNIIESTTIQMNLKTTDNLVELILSDYEKKGRAPQYIGGSQSATYGIKCLIKLKEAKDISIFNKIKSSLEKTYEK